MKHTAINFFELLNGYADNPKINKIVIPEIQRDYVYGRVSKAETDARESLIPDLIETLVSGKEMELFFIYGKIDEENSEFIPLDGQQRLTTLFLLYWYLSTDNSDLDKIRYKERDAFSPRFTYETRKYAKSFFNYLINYSYDEITENYDRTKEKEWILSECIRDKNWFGYSWDSDPTVKSALKILDTFEEKIPSAKRKDYIKNFDMIKFFFLNLGDYGMTDKLYIKMNDRGKKLSDFDFTKSTFSGDVFDIYKDSTISNDKWDSCFDNNWMDCFWRFCFNTQKIFDEPLIEESEPEQRKILIRKETVNRVEKTYSYFINKVMLIFLSDKQVFELLKSDKEKEVYDKYYSSIKELPDIYDLSKLINSESKMLRQPIKNSKYANFYDFFSKVMDRFFYQSDNNIFPVTDLLKDYITYNIYSDSKKDFLNIINKSKLEIDENLLFLSVVDFILCDGFSAQEIIEDEAKKKKFLEWSLFCRNMLISYNTFIDKPKSYRDMCECLNDWAEILSTNDWNLRDNIDSLHLSFSDNYLNDQLSEEKLKYSLTKNNEILFEKIRLFENKKIYVGQIRFLLNISKEAGVFNERLFDDRKDRLNQIFLDGEQDKNILNLLRQVLLCFDDWTLKFNEDTSLPRRCFCQINYDRDYSWRAFLRKESSYKVLKQMLDDWKDNASNQTFIEYATNKVLSTKNSNSIKDWRKYFIENEKVFDFMQKYVMVQKYKDTDHEIFLLLRSSENCMFNSNYGELYSVSIYFRKNTIEEISQKYIVTNSNADSFNIVKFSGKNGEIINVKAHEVSEHMIYELFKDEECINKNATINDVEAFLSLYT